MDKRIERINHSLMGEVRKWLRIYEMELDCPSIAVGPHARDLANITWCLANAVKNAHYDFEELWRDEEYATNPKTAPLKPGESDGFAPANDMQSATVRGQDEYNRMKSGMWPR